MTATTPPTGPAGHTVPGRPPTTPGAIARLAATARDPLMLNSFFLIATTALGAGAGFLFWILVARLFPASDVGRASSLLSSASLLSYFSLFGLSSTLVRHLPTSTRQAEETSTAISTVVLAACVISGGFVVVVPWAAPQLDFLHASPLHAVGFVVLAAGAAVNLLTDSVFVAFRAAKVNLAVNGGLMSVVKLGMPVLFVGLGPFGIFAASGVASAVAATASVVAIRRVLRVRVRPSFSWRTFRSTLGYSLSSYLSGSLNLIPQIVLPIVVLQTLGPVPAATYFVAFQIANLVNSASYAIGEALFAEGSQQGAQLGPIARRSAKAIFAVTVPAVVLVVALAGPVLRLFGPEYATDGRQTLTVFTVGALAVAFNTWASFLLKVTRQLVAMVVSNLVLVVVMLVIALARLDHGLEWAGIAWGVGNLASGAVAGLGLLWSGMREPYKGRHRRHKRKGGGSS
ncbi:lipopolysaccharide biosynthesis protein [Streptomyces gilvus]|uniref:lipopolysaccharide biosynthesis protein n=1 Tax=Streptomyces gilvus TaxID=2920937 RepID=UPI001F1050F7|nr:oligosaccharide flippase family protein [Streptomyces sp. CME 23]MCH5673544.1 oligosaccharide flippase family protein [Streptomyces sp. CME 23]